MKNTLLFFSLLFTLTTYAKTPEVVKGLKSPESVVQAQSGILYVTEIGEFGKDGDGKISMVKKNGIVKTFATGMDDPKGIVIVKNKTMYVADKTKVLAIDNQGNVKTFVDAADFPSPPQFLNDIEADRQGNLYVSDSGDLKSGGAVYKINKDKKIETIVDSTNPKVLAPNGLLYEGRNRLLMVDFESGILYRINLMTKTLSEIAGGFGGGDGIVKTKKGKIYITDWKNGFVNRLAARKARIVERNLDGAADMTLSNNGEYLIVPVMKAGTIEFIDIK